MQNCQCIIKSNEAEHNKNISDKEEDCLSAMLSVQVCGKSVEESYSISSPSHICHSSFVSDSIAQVPLLKASVSTIHRYNVGKAMGKNVPARGSWIINRYARFL